MEYHKKIPLPLKGGEYFLTPGLISVSNNHVYCKLRNDNVKDLTQDTVYNHPTEKQCKYEPDLSNYVTKDEIGSLVPGNKYKLIASGTVRYDSTQNVIGNVNNLSEYSDIFVIAGNGNNYGAIAISVDVTLVGEYLNFKNLDNTPNATELMTSYSGGQTIYPAINTATDEIRIKIENVIDHSFVTLLYSRCALSIGYTAADYPDMPIILHGSSIINTLRIGHRNANRGLQFPWKVYAR